MQIKHNICGVDVEFHQAPFHCTNTAISFKQGDIEILVKEVDTNRDYNPLFTTMHVKGTYTHGDVVFSWPTENTMEIAQGDRKIRLDNIMDKVEGCGELTSNYEVLCFLAFGRCIDPY